MTDQQRDSLSAIIANSFGGVDRHEGIADGWLQDTWFVGMSKAGEALYIMDAGCDVAGIDRPCPGLFVVAYTLTDGYVTGDEDKMRYVTDGPVMLPFAADAIRKEL